MGTYRWQETTPSDSIVELVDMKCLLFNLPLVPMGSEGVGLAANACNFGLHLATESPPPWLTGKLAGTSCMALP